MTPEARLRTLGLALPPLPAPVGRFVAARAEGGLLHLSGQGPVRPDGTLATGLVGAGVTAEEARDHARLCALTLCAAMREALGSLDRVAGLVRLLGFVQAAPGFARHPFVLDGASDLFHHLWGEAGRHARSAVGVASLPGNITVEVEAVARLSP